MRQTVIPTVDRGAVLAAEKVARVPVGGADEGKGVDLGKIEGLNLAPLKVFVFVPAVGKKFNIRLGSPVTNRNVLIAMQ
ncbi:MAG: hypothetical protein IMY76_02845 [Chloroflexi bacterium]|nr:hypothetical protein [Chloroflexota bacterium]